MSEVKGYPHKQTFNISGRKNLTKKNAWWQLGKSNNRKETKKED